MTGFVADTLQFSLKDGSTYFFPQTSSAMALSKMMILRALSQTLFLSAILVITTTGDWREQDKRGGPTTMEVRASLNTRHTKRIIMYTYIEGWDDPSKHDHGHHSNLGRSSKQRMIPKSPTFTRSLGRASFLTRYTGLIHDHFRCDIGAQSPPSDKDAISSWVNEIGLHQYIEARTAEDVIKRVNNAMRRRGCQPSH